jgi:hypothetical protein
LKSKLETQWLDYLGIDKDQRQQIIICGNNKYIVDAFDPEANIVYEFYGDYWHGNPEIYDHRKFNTKCKKTFGKLYKETINRKEDLESHGYHVVYTWEHDFKKLIKT